MSLVSPTIRLFHTRAAAAVAAAGKGMEISIVPMLKDNLGYLVRCKATQKACFIDISHSSVSKFYHALDTHHVELSAENLIVLTTHKVIR